MMQTLLIRQRLAGRFTHALAGLAAGIALLGLSGCAGSDTGPTSYVLPSTPASSQYPNQLAVIVAPVRIASHLDTDGIVMQLNDIEVYQARQHLWAQELSQQLQQQLQHRLALRLPKAQIISQGQPRLAGVPVRELRLQVTRFQGQATGDALAEGQWQLLDDRGQLLRQAHFSVTQPLADDGYPALVRALGGAWEQLADTLAAELVRR